MASNTGPGGNRVRASKSLTRERAAQRGQIAPMEKLARQGKPVYGDFGAVTKKDSAAPKATQRKWASQEAGAAKRAAARYAAKESAAAKRASANRQVGRKGK